jgi:hypothetical protein
LPSSQGLRMFSALGEDCVSTHLHARRGCIWVATGVVGMSNERELHRKLTARWRTARTLATCRSG